MMTLYHFYYLFTVANPQNADKEVKNHNFNKNLGGVRKHLEIDSQNNSNCCNTIVK